MLVQNRAIKVRPVQNIARIAHAQSERNCLFATHTFKIGCHRQCRDLTLGDTFVGYAANERRNLIGFQSLAITFLANDFLRDDLNSQISKSDSNGQTLFCILPSTACGINNVTTGWLEPQKLPR